MKRALLVSILAMRALTAAAHDDFLVDLRAPAGTAWTVSTRDAQRSGSMPGGSGMTAMTTSVAGYVTHDGRELINATFAGPGGTCPQVQVGVYEPQNHFEMTCRPTFVYDGASCASSCAAVPTNPVTAAAPLAFPNPLRRPAEQMHFQDLPSNSRVRIYTSAGRLVYEQTADVSGHMTWRGEDASGRAVGSGIYHVVAKGDGGTVTMSVAVQR